MSKCILKEEINKNKEYFYLDELNSKCKKCSDAMKNCLYCTNGNVCDKCMENDYYINDKTNACYEESEINMNEYFLNEDNTTYLSCEIYNINSNCKECSNKTICNQCIDKYYLSNGTCKKSSSDCIYKKIDNLFLLYLAMTILILF